MSRDDAWACFWMIVGIIVVFGTPWAFSEYCRRNDEKNERERAR